MCTHINYAFAKVDTESHRIKSIEWNDQGELTRRDKHTVSLVPTTVTYPSTRLISYFHRHGLSLVNLDNLAA